VLVPGIVLGSIVNAVLARVWQVDAPMPLVVMMVLVLVTVRVRVIAPICLLRT